MLQTLPRLLRLVWSAAPGVFLANVAVTLCASLVPVAQLYAAKLVVDALVAAIGPTAAGASQVWEAVWILASLQVASFALAHVGSYVQQLLQDNFAMHANGLLLGHATRLDLAHFELPAFYDTLQRAQNDGSSYPVRVLSSLTSLGGHVAGLVGLLTLLFGFEPLLMFFLLATAAPVFWVGVKFSGRRFWLARSRTQSLRLADYMRRVLTEGAYVKEVRLFGLGAHFLFRWRALRERYNTDIRALQLKHSGARLGVDLFAALGYFAAYAFVIRRALERTISVGDLAMYAGAFQQAQAALSGLLMGVSNIYEYNLYVAQFFEFLDLEPQIVDNQAARPFPEPLRTGISFEDVTFTYPGSSKPTLRNVTFSVRAGECIALVGANGSGKTTLLKLLARFYDPDSGNVAVDGIALPKIAMAGLRRNIGVIFQDFAKYSFSAADNVGFGDLSAYSQSPIPMERVHAAADKAGAHEVIHSLSKGYETTLGKTFDGGVELSGGQWQKIGLARAFMSPAPILILDEPTAAVDALAEFDLYERFRELTRGKTTFLVSHRFSTVRLADRIVVLEGGAVIEVGSHAELLASKGLYERMFRLQAASYLEDPTTVQSAPFD